jgi:glycosyltransferase involved in cell wall biosynthesis
MKGVPILMVTYNQERFVRRAVESVLAQTYRDFELVVIDDASTDGTQETLKDLSDPRIRVICRQTNGGLLEAYRQGIDACAGEYLAFLEGDDEWLPGNLAEKMDVFQRYPEVGLVYSNVNLDVPEPVCEAKRQYLCRILSVPVNRPFDASLFVSYMNPIPAFSAVVVKRELLRELEYPSEQEQAWLDWFFWNRISYRAPFFFLPQPLVIWRHHADSLYGRMEKQGSARVKSTEVRLRFRFLRQAWRQRLPAGKKIAITARFFLGMAKVATAAFICPLQEFKKTL